MSAPGNTAVFLSYASQDADAARRICDALRSVGVEVWFDQSELRGGDAWDTKIRKQIKECALFVPVISANTQARREGYFRLEWKLADDRTHLMAKGTPFIVPVCVDDTKDWNALVPDSFMVVQWTRLPGGETSASFCARVKALLCGEVGQPTRSTAATPMAGGTPALPGKSRRPWRMLAVVVAAAVIALALGMWRPWRQPAVSTAVAPAPAMASTSVSSESEQLARRGISLTTKLNFSRDDLAVAADLTDKATRLQPDLALAWGARARVEAAWLHRNWDISEKRRQSVFEFARRALALNPDEPNALWSQGIVLRRQRALTEAEALFQRALAVAPDDNYIRRALAGSLSERGRDTEAQAVYEEGVRRDPRDALAHYSLSLLFVRGGGVRDNDPRNLDVALGHLDRALAVQTFASALTQKATVQAAWQGDLAGARTTLDRLAELPLAERSDDRTIYTLMWLALLERKPGLALAAPALSTLTYFEDAVVAEPIGWMKALAHRVAGRENAARQEWRAAEQVLRDRLQRDPNSLVTQSELAVTLAWLGERAEAARVFARFDAVARERWRGVTIFNHARYHAGMGDAAATAATLAAARDPRPMAWCSDAMLRLDPWFDKVRAAREFEELLAKPALSPTMAPDVTRTPSSPSASSSQRSHTDAKSVAVLAFENRSDDKANEYLSDGISEELLNVLAKVPGLKVTARTSAFHFKHKGTPIPEIARQLGVAYVVEGSVQKVGSRVRIKAQLVNAADGFQVWSDSFDRELKDIFALQDEIAGLIAKALSLKLGTASPTATAAVNPEALRLYLEGRQMWNLRTPEAFARADMLFRRALELEPNFARALAGLADVGVVRRSGSGQRLSQREEIVAQAERAIALYPSLAEPHATLGLLEFMDWNFEAADRHFQRAFALNPSYAWAHLWRGQSFMTQGRVDEAMAENQRALEADPLAPRIASNTALLHLLAGRPADALVSADRSLSLLPGEPQAQTWKAEALLMLGRVEEALKIAREALAINPSRPDFTYVLARAGDPQEVAVAVSAPDVRFTNRTRSLLATGRVNEALAGLEADAKDSVFGFQFVLFHPAFDEIRKDPRFVKMLETLRMTEVHTRAQAWRAANPRKKPEARK